MKTERIFCKYCNGTGWSGHYRMIGGGQVQREPIDCVQCGGEGQLWRETEDTEDKQTRMRKLGNEQANKRAGIKPPTPIRSRGITLAKNKDQ